MKMLKGQLFILLIVYINGSLCDFQAIYDAGEEIWKLYSIISNMTSTTHYIVFHLYKYQVNEVHEKLQKIENSMDSIIISDSFKSLPYSTNLYKSIDTLEIFILAVDQHYDKFRQQISELEYNADNSRDLMRSVIPDIEEKILTIRRKVLEPNELLGQNLIFAITGHVAIAEPYLCKSPRIISNILVQLFKMIVIAEMKAHVMSATANRHQYLPSNDAGWMNHLSRETLEMQIGRYVNLFALNLPITDAVYLKACEPYDNRWIRGIYIILNDTPEKDIEMNYSAGYFLSDPKFADKSFYELEGTFQTAIFGYNRQKCNVNDCHDIWFKESRTCEAHYYDDRSGCSGNLTDCFDLNTIQACVLKSGPRKFHYVNSTTKGFFGKTSGCPSSNRIHRNLYNSTCACNCYGNDNKISLLIMESDVKSNMVITGLRFIRQDRILWIQPREGKLYSDGRIRHYSQRWIPIPKNIPESQVHPINRENRVFFFDNLRLPSSFVLTGVKFNRVQRLSVIGFAVKIFGVPFNFESGELNADPNFVVSKQALDNDLGEPLLFMTINPASATLPLTLSPANKKYVTLERSNLRNDFGQSTLPFFDDVPVITNPPLPLGGIGIFHKGAAGTSGFISPRVYGIKYAHFFTDFQATCMKNDKVLFKWIQRSS